MEVKENTPETLLADPRFENLLAKAEAHQREYRPDGDSFCIARIMNMALLDSDAARDGRANKLLKALHTRAISNLHSTRE